MVRRAGWTAITLPPGRSTRNNSAIRGFGSAASASTPCRQITSRVAAADVGGAEGFAVEEAVEVVGCPGRVGAGRGFDRGRSGPELQVTRLTAVHRPPPAVRRLTRRPVTPGTRSPLIPDPPAPVKAG